MKPEDRSRDPLPDESASIEEIAEFWDTHDTADYEDAFVTVDAEFDLQRRHFEVEIKEDIFQALRQRAAKLRVPVEKILDDLLRNDLLPSRSG
ncbi:MAG: CopG family antitoxin [Thermoanaerobaculia bacterium]